MIWSRFYTWCSWENVKCCMWICPHHRVMVLAGCLCLMELVLYLLLQWGVWPAWGLQVFCWFFFFLSSFGILFDVFGWESSLSCLFFSLMLYFWVSDYSCFSSLNTSNLYETFCILTLPLFNLVIFFYFVFFGAHYWVTITYRLLHFYAFWNDSYFCVSVFLTYGYHYIFWKLHSKYLEGACVPVWMGMMLLSVCVCVCGGGGGGGVILLSCFAASFFSSDLDSYFLLFCSQVSQINSSALCKKTRWDNLGTKRKLVLGRSSLTLDNSASFPRLPGE